MACHVPICTPRYKVAKSLGDDDNSRHAIFPLLWREVYRRGSSEDDHKEEEEEEEEKWSQKKEQLTVIIVMFNQTPAIKLINTLFPVWVHMRWVPLRQRSAL